MRKIRYKQGIANDSFLLALVRCMTYVSSFAQTMIMSRVLSKLEYGRYSQACLIVTFISPFLLLGLSNAVNYFYNRENEKDKYVQAIFSMIIVLGTGGGIGIVLLHNVIANYFHNSSIIVLIYIIAFRPLFQNLIAFFQVLYISSNRALIIVIRNFILALLQCGIVVVAVYLFESVELVLILLTLTDFVQVLIFYIYFSNQIMPLKFGKVSIFLLPKILKYALPLALSTMVGTLSINMDLLLIGKMMSTEEFAIYSNMAKELPFNFLITSFTDVVFPQIIRLRSKNDKIGVVHIYKVYIEFGIISTWIMISGAIVSAKDIVLILYSDKYISGITIFYIYLLVSSLRFTYHGMLLSAYGKSGKIFKYSVIALIINFFLNIIFFYLLGIIGPAIATFIAVFITALLQLLEGTKLMDVSIREIFDLKYLIKFISESLILMCVAMIISNKILTEIPVLIRFLLVYGTFICSMVFLNKERLLNDLRILNRG